MRKILYIILLCALFFGGGFLTRHLCHFPATQEGVKVKVDTLYQKDTILVYEPKIVQRTQIDTLWQIVENFKEVHDTLYVPMPVERVVYQDTSYRAVVSGWHPRLEELEIYRTDKVVTVQTERIVRERSRWGLGVQAGAGLNASGQLQPYIGLGLSYNFFSF